VVTTGQAASGGQGRLALAFSHCRNEVLVDSSWCGRGVHDARAGGQHRSWISPCVPRALSVRAARVLDLCVRVFDGQLLAEYDYVLSANEKPGVQAHRSPLAAHDMHRSRDRPLRTSAVGHLSMLVAVTQVSSWVREVLMLLTPPATCL
jgi:hypothetical protein